MPFDPTGTARIRASFRRAGLQRIQKTLRFTKQVLAQQDILGLRPPDGMRGAFMPNSANAEKLGMFGEWFKTMAHDTIVGDSKWLRHHVLQAYDSGLLAAEQYTKRAATSHLDELHHTHARHEVTGIVDATSQKVNRTVMHGVRLKKNPHTLYNLLSRDVRSVAVTRFNSFANVTVVAAHNQARIDEFKKAGMVTVGIIPERLPKHGNRVHDCCQFHDLELVNILTAGDDDVCPECEDYADAAPYDIDEVEIPLHPNCRCTVVPADDRRFAEPERSEEWFQ